jgi:predicted Zn-dependent protease
MLPLEEQLKKAQELNKAKKYSEVIELLTDKVLEEYKSADLWTEKAEAYYRLKNNKLCDEAVDKALLIKFPFHLRYILNWCP